MHLRDVPVSLSHSWWMLTTSNDCRMTTVSAGLPDDLMSLTRSMCSPSGVNAFHNEGVSFGQKDA